jgi:N4-(beta-N-acetylglucosaminyl)-L-asparaginase
MIRRKFLKKAAIGLPLTPSILKSMGAKKKGLTNGLVISTWNNIPANDAAWKIIDQGGYALDAVECGVKIPEANPKDASVGYGGRPDRDGEVTLDACIMDEQGMAGSVCFLKEIKHPISVARKVMETTPHVILAGEGALKFALEQGFERTNLLTKESKKAWLKWKEKEQFEPVINIENHDTIGMLALDQENRLCGACTTSGLAFKMAGRVGDSPIIGAGLFVDGEVGGAAATGMGELVLRTLGSFLVVEFMRQGFSPSESCKKAVLRIIEKHPNYKDFQVGFISANLAGEVGAYSIHPGFMYALSQGAKTKLVSSASFL